MRLQQVTAIRANMIFFIIFSIVGFWELVKQTNETNKKEIFFKIGFPIGVAILRFFVELSFYNQMFGNASHLTIETLTSDFDALDAMGETRSGLTFERAPGFAWDGVTILGFLPVPPRHQTTQQHQNGICYLLYYFFCGLQAFP